MLVCAFVLGISAISFAQGGGRRSPADQAAALKTSLSLNDDQTAKVTAIYVAAGKTRDSLMANAGDDRAAMMQTFMKMQGTTDVKIKAVLTADQATAYQKIADERAAQMKARMQGN
jgi:protein CpxP